MKILTALACIETLGDSIPSFAYSEKGDTTYISPLADPTFLYPPFAEQPAFDYLCKKNVFIQYPKAKLPRYGSGWSWSDYSSSYMTEIAWFPLYGNVVRIFRDSSIYEVQVVPEFFSNFTTVTVGESNWDWLDRAERSNIFHAWLESDTSTFAREVPFTFDTELLTQLLADTLDVAVTLADDIPTPTDTLYSQSVDFAISNMLLPSDNFLAEHFLVQCALISGYTDMYEYREMLTEKWTTFMPDPMRWVDGSGLSRYNLVTPRSFVKALEQIYERKDLEWIKMAFPNGGETGTIKSWYKGNPEPYVFAKTGTLSNNHCLSGFIQTKSGKLLIFSLMNNHYLSSSRSVKEEMEKLLEKIRDAY